VFGNRKGEPFRESMMLTRVLQPAAETAGLGRVTWHQFRHIHSSLLNDLGVPATIAQEQIGHASISTTLGIYTHVVDALHPQVTVLTRNLEAPPGFEPGIEVLQIS
jgi:integrase